MDGYRPGYSLRYGLSPKTAVEMAELIENFACGACAKTHHVDIDLGQVYNIGFLLYQEVLKTCKCGFSTRIFIHTNDVQRLKVSTVMSTDQALEQAMDKLPHPILEEGYAHIMLARFQNNLEKATVMAEALVMKFPEEPIPWYDLGWLYGEQARWTDAVAAYQRAHDLDPELADAWYNQGLLYVRMGKYREAGLCLEHYSKLRPDDDSAAGFQPKELARKQGQFGTLRVLEDHYTRRLMIEGQIQGGAFLHPGVELFYEDLQGPGPAAEGFYTVAWYLPAIGAPAGQGLVLGLGSGMGVVTVLHHFPELTIHVVEIDRHMIDLAREYFPLVSYFENQGRLIIHHNDARQFVTDHHDHYDFVALDLFSGEMQQEDVATEHWFLEKLAQLSPAIWMNIPGLLENPYLKKVLNDFASAGLSVEYLSALNPPRHWQTTASNWLLSTVFPNMATVAAFVPFDGFKGPAAEEVRKKFEIWTRFYMNGQQVQAWRNQGTLPEFLQAKSS